MLHSGVALPMAELRAALQRFLSLLPSDEAKKSQDEVRLRVLERSPQDGVLEMGGSREEAGQPQPSAEAPEWSSLACLQKSLTNLLRTHPDIFGENTQHLIDPVDEMLKKYSTGPCLANDKLLMALINDHVAPAELLFADMGKEALRGDNFKQEVVNLTERAKDLCHRLSKDDLPDRVQQEAERDAIIEQLFRQHKAIEQVGQEPSNLSSFLDSGLCSLSTACEQQLQFAMRCETLLAEQRKLGEEEACRLEAEAADAKEAHQEAERTISQLGANVMRDLQSILATMQQAKMHHTRVQELCHERDLVQKKLDKTVEEQMHKAEQHRRDASGYKRGQELLATFSEWLSGSLSWLKTKLAHQRARILAELVEEQRNFGSLLMMVVKDSSRVVPVRDTFIHFSSVTDKEGRCSRRNSSCPPTVSPTLSPSTTPASSRASSKSVASSSPSSSSSGSDGLLHLRGHGTGKGVEDSMPPHAPPLPGLRQEISSPDCRQGGKGFSHKGDPYGSNTSHFSRRDGYGANQGLAPPPRYSRGKGKGPTFEVFDPAPSQTQNSAGGKSFGGNSQQDGAGDYRRGKGGNDVDGKGRCYPDRKGVFSGRDFYQGDYVKGYGSPKGKGLHPGRNFEMDIGHQSWQSPWQGQASDQYHCWQASQAILAALRGGPSDPHRELEEAALFEVIQHLDRTTGFVRIRDWGRRYKDRLGDLRSFLELRSDYFVVTRTHGRQFRVALV